MNPDKLMRLPVSELTTEGVLLSPNESVSKVLGFLRTSGLHEALIEEGERTAVVTIRDFLDAPNIATTLVPTLMHHVPRLNPNNTVSDAAQLMHEYRIRSLPVYRGKKFVGQVTSQLILGKLLESEISTKISSIMTGNPILIDTSTKVSKARAIMVRRRIDQIPVVKEGRLYGVVTSDQIAFNLIPWADRNLKGDWREGRFDAPVGTYALRDVVTNEPTDSVRDIFLTMSNKGANYSVIMSVGEILGIVTYRDFMKMLIRQKTESIPVYMVGLPEDPFEAELARTKFTTAIQHLRMGLPEITEARAIIKIGETSAPRKKYQVRVLVTSPYRRYNYRVFSYELADAFDYVDGWSKKLLSQRESRLKRRTNRTAYSVPSR